MNLSTAHIVYPRKERTVNSFEFYALLADRAELVALYREAMKVARDCAGTMSSSFPKKCHVFYDKLDALDARFKKMEQPND